MGRSSWAVTFRSRVGVRRYIPVSRIEYWALARDRKRDTNRRPARSRARGSEKLLLRQPVSMRSLARHGLAPGTLQFEMSTRQEGDGSRADVPLGKARSIGWTILLSIVTLGIWTCIWSFSNGGELKRYRPDGLGGGVYLVLAIFISPVVMFLMAGEVAKLYEEAGEEPRSGHLGPMVPPATHRQHPLVRPDTELTQRLLDLSGGTGRVGRLTDPSTA